MTEWLDSEFNPLRKQKSSLVFTIFTSLLIFIMLFLMLFLTNVSLCTVNMTSMYPTLNDGDNVLINIKVNDYNRGDIIVIDSTNYDSSFDSIKYIIKRIVATEGDTIKFCQNNSNTIDFYLKTKSDDDFILQQEDYIYETMLTDGFYNSTIVFDTDIYIEENCIFALGDNRNNSLDSRKYGSFSTDDIIGTMFYQLKSGSFLENLLLLIY